ncbi:MAG: hypothetical protein FWC66_07655 [Oscillospiraceae bacterium]|nr:hypothetical protein [Oscillospiraceae bacterium]
MERTEMIMKKRLKRWIVLFLIMMMILSSASAFAIDTELPEYEAEHIAMCDGLISPPRFYNLESLLDAIAIDKFHELRRGRDGIGQLSEFFMPLDVPDRFHLVLIEFWDFEPNSPISLWYSPANNRLPPSLFRTAPPEFMWLRDDPRDEALLWIGDDRASWGQHGYAFQTEFPVCFTEQEIVNFIRAVPVTAWELQGNAISVSIQGMENIRIFDEVGNEIISPTPGIYLYKNDSESVRRIGYRYGIGAGLSRYQFVLEPGTYTFHAEGVIGDPGLLVMHFIDGEPVTSIDRSAGLAEQDISEFSLTVRPGPRML